MKKRTTADLCWNLSKEWDLFLLVMHRKETILPETAPGPIAEVDKLSVSKLSTWPASLHLTIEMFFFLSFFIYGTPFSLFFFFLCLPLIGSFKQHPVGGSWHSKWHVWSWCNSEIILLELVFSNKIESTKPS